MRWRRWRSATSAGAQEEHTVVYSAATCVPLEGVRVCLLSEDREVIACKFTDRKGEYAPFTEVGAALRFEGSGFTTKELALDECLGRKVRLLEDRLTGYLDTLCTTPGAPVVARVHSPRPFRAGLYRHGLVVDHVLDLGVCEAVEQLVPEGHFVATGLDWQATMQFRIPADARSGLYSLRLSDLAAGSESIALPLVVAPDPTDRGRGHVVVVASTATWVAYNRWGGRSNYRTNERSIQTRSARVRHLLRRWAGKPVAPARRWLRAAGGDLPGRVPQWRREPLSLRRPLQHLGDLVGDDVMARFRSPLAGTEWRVLAWLEREGFSYDVVACEDVDREPDILKCYSAVVLNGHSEYWTVTMLRSLIESWRAGKWVLNLSGNSIYRGAEYLGTNAMRCINEGLTEWRSEVVNVLGVGYDSRGLGTCAPYRVLAPEHWVFGGSGVKQNDEFAGECLNGCVEGRGGSGGETDKLIQASPADTVLLARGTNPHGGGADMTLREPGDGHGGVFSASSIQFGGSLLVDAVASSAVRNVLERARSSGREPMH